MINTEMLMDKMKSERWSIRQMSHEIGISHTSLSNKLRGEYEFKADEILTLKNLLHLTNDETIAIFLAQNVDGKSL